ncbi:hypothetical protein HYW17_02290 [Candidatus Uhrbacteria bacterium]|nr:hypothetical protein [Candidatus Uhrbacteria bacterium]
MTRFTITCFCGRKHIKFRSPKNYSAGVIARLYCSSCSKKAPREALIIEVTGLYEYDGRYAITWNPAILAALDPQYRARPRWKEDFFGKRKLIFDFIPPGARGVFRVG